jgi:hypothetical protein
VYDEDTGDLIGSAQDGQLSATGNTNYPWQASWGSNNSVGRTDTTNSVAAGIGSTVAKWKNKIGSLSQIYDGHLTQSALSVLPILRASYGNGNKKGIEFTSDALNAMFSRNISQIRTYYIVAQNQGTSGSSYVMGSSNSGSPGSTQRRCTLMHNGSYGLSNGGSAAFTKYSNISLDGGTHIACASFDSNNTGKIRVKKPFVDTEVDITGLAIINPANWSSANALYVGPITFGAYMNVFEILFYEGAHTTEQKNQVINYLTTKHSDLFL